MPARVSLIWQEAPGLSGLDPAQVALAAGVELDDGGLVEAAVVTVAQERAPRGLQERLAGLPVSWLDLAAEIGGGGDAHRLARAAAAVARAAGRAAKGTLPPVYAPQPAQSVLVAGAGLGALAAAWEAAALGHPVTLATPFGDAATPGADDDPQAVGLMAAQLPAQVELATECELIGLAGSAGGFSARLMGPQGESSQGFGAVFLAPPGELAPGCEIHGLNPELCVLASKLDPEDWQGPEDAWLHAAVLAGSAQAAPSYSFAAALEAALALAKRPRVQVSLFYTEARVAVPGAERLFRDCRAAGVLPMRVEPGGLEVRGGHTLAWFDPLLGEEITLEPAVAVMAEQSGAPRPAWLDNELTVKPWDLLVPENPRLAGGKTSRSGLYILGSLRGTAPGAPRRAEAAAATADMHARLTGRVVPMPAVRDQLCARCLSCVRACPHGVPQFVGFGIACSPAGCVACGICAAECPAEAIAPPGWGQPEMLAALEAALAVAPEPKMVLFACGQSGMPAASALSASGHQWPAGLVIFPLVCAGRTSQVLVTRALELGAKGVLTAGCHPGNCRSISGNLVAAAKLEMVQGMLAELGLDPEAVSFLPLASNQTRELAQAVEALAVKAEEA
ncbi:MAG: hydrogenase iron-sulfur subunit [Desulfarculaceae bacterium]|nr:hydrogenase iron-sulfur subunit [Desulfarculaceae bacterium]